MVKTIRQKAGIGIDQMELSGIGIDPMSVGGQKRFRSIVIE